ncbi:class I SAM-dependent methyltransferase [Paludifilum halophilum]|uniref:Uncharacterized protein n=1 Tax=Paludifilum halophilum TaxID=1642702 RepID=A0A235B761_9BACL|nr:methyltransferase domain-containing protein [Paludifilum halophilum]OYD08134.1 hypothetical protein CHM34_08470 [Paludifilum halophilum]
MISSRILFLLKFARSPRTIGSITPSSSFLASKMLQPIHWPSTRTIVELGAGTGPVTALIHRNKTKDCRAFIFEKDPELRRQLMIDYPHMVHASDAEHLSSELKSHGVNQVDGVISSLPFASLPKPVRKRILDEVQSILKPGGPFIAFQYSLQLKRQLAQRFPQVDLHFVPLNLPPAFVYSCR